MRTASWQTTWVGDMPSSMSDGTVYISVKHRLTEHLCACGCKAEVSLPLGPAEWRLEYDGETIGLRPSVGNWRLPCKSHYLIEQSRTVWCRPWTPDEVVAGRTEDRRERDEGIQNRNRERKWWWRLVRLVKNSSRRRFRK